MKWISLRIGTLLVALAIGALSGTPQAARAEVVPTPELGVTWEFECDFHGKQQIRLTAFAKAIEDGALVIALSQQVELRADRRSREELLEVGVVHLDRSSG